MRNKIIAFDLDDVLCFRTSEIGDIEKYSSCKPNNKMISLVNICKSKGHKIIVYTSRGMTVFKGNRDLIYSNLYDLTIKQLEGLGVQFDQLIMGKVHYDLLIDDKAIDSDLINSLSDIEKQLQKVIDL